MNSTTDSPKKPRTVNCPTCSDTVLWVESNTWRPFCSERCQLIDFGDWASEKNTIPVEEGPENDDY